MPTKNVNLKKNVKRETNKIMKKRGNKNLRNLKEWRKKSKSKMKKKDKKNKGKNREKKKQIKIRKRKIINKNKERKRTRVKRKDKMEGGEERRKQAGSPGLTGHHSQLPGL